jgi:hypothetical protein
LLETRASTYSGAQTNEQIGLDEGNRCGLVEPAHSADAAMYSIPHKTMIHTNCVTSHVGACGGILLKML